MPRRGTPSRRRCRASFPAGRPPGSFPRVDLSALFTYFVGFSIWSFAGRLDFYGRHLSAETARGVTLFVPPLFGRETIGGLLVSSSPAPGFFAIAAAGLLLAFAVAVTWRRGRSEMASEIRMAA